MLSWLLLKPHFEVFLDLFLLIESWSPRGVLQFEQFKSLLLLLAGGSFTMKLTINFVGFLCVWYSLLFTTKPKPQLFPNASLYALYFPVVFFWFWHLWDHNLNISRSPCPPLLLSRLHIIFLVLKKGSCNHSLDLIVVLEHHFTLQIFASWKG